MWKICFILVMLEVTLTVLSIPLQPDENLPEDSHCQCLCSQSCSCFLQDKRIEITCLDENDEMQINPSISSFSISGVLEEPGLVLSSDALSTIDVTNLNVVSITNSTVKFLHKTFFEKITNLNNLNLSSNHLRELPSGLFQGNKQLRVLDLSDNPLIIPNDGSSPFLIAPHLNRIDMSKCRLDTLPYTAFIHMNYIEELQLSSNFLKSIDNSTFMYLEMLQELDLSNNQLKEIPSDTFIHNQELTELYLNSNPLKTLKRIEIPSLNKLQVKNCKLTSLDEDTLSGFPDLIDLSLKSNSITKINKKAFSNLQELMYLDLSDNKLTGPLHSQLFVSNQKLEVLVFSNNVNMQRLPQEGFSGRFIELYKFDLANCGLTDLNRFSFANMSELSTLNLSSNAIESIRRGTFPRSLITLDLSRNQITDLENVNIPYDTEIRRLILKGNPLQKLSPVVLSNIHNLIKLDVSFCRIKSLWGDQIPEQFFPRLEFLHLQNNKITSLSPGELEMIDSLIFLDISNNPLKCDKSFNNLVKWLNEKMIQKNSLDSDTVLSGDKNLEAEDIPDDIDGQPTDKLGWNKLVSQVCDVKHTTVINKPLRIEAAAHPTINTYLDTWKTPQTVVPEYTSNSTLYSVVSQITNSQTTISTWLIVFITLLSILIFAVLIILTIFYLRWSRQRSIYNRKHIIKRAISTPKLRRDDSSYRPLQEDMNTPTTPMVTPKIGIISEERNKFENNDVGNHTYRSTTYKNSKLLP